MSTGLIVTLIVIVAAVVVVAAALTLRNRGAHGGRGLRRRFGPEYDRAVARHDGDTKAAESELAQRVERHGSLEFRPVEPDEHERWTARWSAAQERFVDSPREAVAEVDRLLAEVAGARGFPDADRYDEQLDALSVHHPRHVHGYRRVHLAVRTSGGKEAPSGISGNGGGTEEMREALIEARALFEALTAPDRGSRRAASAAPAPARSRGGSALPWAFGRRHAKGS
jgi:hypothetical protein